MKLRLNTSLALAAISYSLIGCTTLPQTLQRNLDLTPAGKGALTIQLQSKRATQALSDVDHLTVAVQTIDANPSQTLTSAALTNGGASASVTFPALTPCVATVSLGAYNNASEELGTALSTVSIQPLMISQVNMDLTIPGGPPIPVGILVGDATIVDSHYRTTTLAGGMGMGYQDGTGTNAKFSFQGSSSGMTIDPDGNLFVVDYDNFRVRKVTPSGVVTTFAGNGIYEDTSDGTGTAAGFNHAIDIARAPDGNFYVADYWHKTIEPSCKIHKMTPEGVVTTMTLNTGITNIEAIAVGPSGNLYVGDFTNIYKITPAGAVASLAGSGALGFADGTGNGASFKYIYGLVVDANENIYAVDSSNNAIRKVTPGGVVTTIAGGSYGSLDGTGTSAKFSSPRGITIDTAGNLYIGDSYSIRKITPMGVVTTLAGGEAGYADAESGTRARFSNLGGIEVLPNGTMYVVDGGNHAIRKIVP